MAGAGEQFRKGRSGKRRPYCALGKMLDALARRRDVRGPYNIASYLKDVVSYEVSGQAVSKYLYGESWPKLAFTGAFTEALNLTSEERGKLAWVYTYGGTNGEAREGKLGEFENLLLHRPPPPYTHFQV